MGTISAEEIFRILKDDHGSRSRLTKNSKVRITVWLSMDIGDTSFEIAIPWRPKLVKRKYLPGKYYTDDAGKTYTALSFFLHIPPKIIREFLDKFGKPVEHRYKIEGNSEWEIEYGILEIALKLSEKDPRELERITKVAKTKKELKIHLGMS